MLQCKILKDTTVFVLRDQYFLVRNIYMLPTFPCVSYNFLATNMKIILKKIGDFFLKIKKKLFFNLYILKISYILKF